MEDPTGPKAVSNRALARVQREVLCKALGLSMRDITSATIDFGVGTTLVRWEGVRRLNATETAALLATISAAEVSSDG